MSILLIMEELHSGNINLDTTIPCSEKARSMGGSQIWLNETENLTVDEMLKAICVVSANDCTVAMAEYICGSEEFFVNKMNEKAKELGMNDTTFKNCHGIDEDGHITSSYDISLMSRELLTNYPEITKYTTIWTDSLRNGKSELVNTNKLIRTYQGCTGLKTGSTSLALYNLSASATRNNLSLISVVMRAPTPKIRFSEAKLLLDYGFNTYNYIPLTTSGTVIKNQYIEKSIEQNLNIVVEKDFGIISKKNITEDISENIVINEKLEAPIFKNDIIGHIDYIINDNIVGTVNLIAENDIHKKDFINTLKTNILKWINLIS